MQTPGEEDRPELIAEMREHLQCCISPTAHRGCTWEQWKVLAEIAAEIDWQCDFDAQGKCKMARAAPCNGPPLGHIVGNNDRNCCFGCSANMGFLEKVPQAALPHVLAFYDPRFGFWAAGKGCVLPWKWRSHVCLGFSCRSEPKSLRTLVEQFQSVTATSPWRPSLSDEEIAELVQQLRREGLFKSSPSEETRGAAEVENACDQEGGLKILYGNPFPTPDWNCACNCCTTTGQPLH
jgi:hypothetical protein